MESLFCGHLGVYSETFPTSGMTRNGVAYERPTWGPATDGSGSLSSPDGALLMTPVASEGAKPSNTMEVARRLTTGQVFLTNQIVTLCGLDPSEKTLLPTPTVSDTNGPGLHGTGGMDLRTTVSLLPTPKATDGEKGGPNQRGSSGDWPLPAIGHLLPTPTVGMMMGGSATRSGARSTELLLPGVAQSLAPTSSPADGAPAKLLPTTRAQHGMDRNSAIYLRPLDQPQNLENSLARLTGATTSQPSAAGRLDSDGQLHGQLNLLDAITESD